MKEAMNQFGGSWTDDKIDILVEYAQAYLQIMKEHPYWKLLYFDGSAGTGFIDRDNGEFDISATVGAARRIVEINDPTSFTMFYFVEKNKTNAAELAANTKAAFPEKADQIHIVPDDCNKKLVDMAGWLLSESGKNWKVLAYIDPYGMQLEWASIEALKGLPVDIWVLVPTGLGVNRLLKKDGDIADSWLERLRIFLGLSNEQIKAYFYHEEVDATLFGDEILMRKNIDAINQSAVLYKARLEEVFDYVTEPLALINSRGVVMYHFFLASNNGTAVKIGSAVIKKYSKRYTERR